jgi:hypothetical protein
MGTIFIVIILTKVLIRYIKLQAPLIWKQI